MLIDCNECAMQDTVACQDCVVSFVLRDLAGPLEIDDDRAEALEVLADVGLIPELRLVPRSATG
jgi:hypothetical protein